jgi:hypothetical protein
LGKTCSSQPCKCRLISKTRGLRYRPSSGEQAWRKRADLQTRLKALGVDRLLFLLYCLGSDPRQIENIIATRNKIQGVALNPET